MGSPDLEASITRRQSPDRSIAPAWVSCSRNSQRVLASGIRSSSTSLKKRMKESRSRSVLGLIVREAAHRLQVMGAFRESLQPARRMRVG